MTNNTDWTPGQVRAVITNPIYAGVGPYPGIVDDEIWIRTGAKDIREHGLEDFISQVRGGLIDVSLNVPSFDNILAAQPDPETAARQVLEACRKVNPS